MTVQVSSSLTETAAEAAPESTALAPAPALAALSEADRAQLAGLTSAQAADYVQARNTVRTVESSIAAHPDFAFLRDAVAAEIRDKAAFAENVGAGLDILAGMDTAGMPLVVWLAESSIRELEQASEGVVRTALDRLGHLLITQYNQAFTTQLIAFPDSDGGDVLQLGTHFITEIVPVTDTTLPVRQGVVRAVKPKRTRNAEAGTGVTVQQPRPAVIRTTLGPEKYARLAAAAANAHLTVTQFVTTVPGAILHAELLTGQRLQVVTEAGTNGVEKAV